MAAPSDVVKVKKTKRPREDKPVEPVEEPTAPAADAEPSFDVPPPLVSDTEDAPDDDTPALSHKEKRLAKRRKLSGIEEVVKSAPAAPTVPGGPTIGNTPAKSAHGVWVGNLNFNTTSKLLLEWFEERGLKEVTRINMPNGKRPGENNRGSVSFTLSFSFHAEKEK